MVIDIADAFAEILLADKRPPPLSKTEEAQFRFLTTMHLEGYGAVLIEGQPRTGKSLFLAHLAWIRRKFFGYPVVSNNPLKPAFGEYELIDAMWLATELEKVNKIIDEEMQKQKNKKEGVQELNEDASRELLSLWERSGIKLWRSTTLWDEGGQDTDRRRSMSSKNIALGHLCTQFGHYENLLCIVAHDRNIMDSMRQEPFITHEVMCSHWRNYPRPWNPETGDLGTSVYRVYHRHTPPWEPKDGPPPYNPQWITLEVNNWKDLFDTNAPVGVPRNIIKGLIKENRPL